LLALAAAAALLYNKESANDDFKDEDGDRELFREEAIFFTF
jgi:hypothetical protein